MFSIDYSSFHPACAKVFLIQGPDQLYVCCPDHRVITSLASVARKIEPATVNETDPDLRVPYGGKK